MRTKLLLKSLLVAAGLFVGATSAWADEVFGTTSDGYLGAKSTSITIYDGGSLHYQFSQVTAATASAQGFVLVAEDRGGEKIIALRGDNWENVAWANTGCTNNYDWDNYTTYMNGASVDMTVTYSAGTFTMNSTITGSDSNNYTYSYTKDITGAPSVLVVYLSEEAAQITVTKSDYTNNNVVATLVHTASSSTGGTAKQYVETIDAEKEHYNNPAFGGNTWQGAAYAHFSFTIPDGESVESAILVWSAYNGNEKNRSSDLYYVNAGITPDYTETGFGCTTTLTDGVNLSGTSIATGVAISANSSQTYTTDVTAAVRTIVTADQDFIVFKLTNQAAGGDMYGKASAEYYPILIIKTTAATLYNITFAETASVAATIKIDGLDVTAGTTLADGSYDFTATATGYYDYNGNFTVSGADKEVSFTMTAIPTFTYTVNAVDGSDNVLQSAIASKTAYEGETANVTWSKYIKIGSQWYVTSETPFVVAATEAGVKNVVYSTSNIEYFVECENMHGVRSDRDSYEAGGSNNSYIRMSKYSINYYTDNFAEGGIFDLSIPYYNSNEGEETYKIQTTTDGKSFTDTGLTLTCASKGTGNMTQKGIIVPAGSAIAITYSGTGNALARMDYLVLTKSNVSGTLANTYTTLSSAYALDFSSATGIEAAYVVTNITASSVTLKSVDAVPANTGVILKGTKGTAYSIPAIASADAPAKNYLHAAVTAYDCAANEVYILQDGQFHLVTAASTVPAGKAYLLADDVPSTARSLSFSFDGETTGIHSIDNGQLTTDNSVYDLQGRRVITPTRGLYIVNGKKVVIK